jgi:esterase/lipase superfamily enzyme
MAAQRAFLLTCLVVATAAGRSNAARVVNVDVESKLNEGKQLVQIELLLDRGEAAVEIEVLAILFDPATVPPIRPILSNDPASRSETGQYVAKTTVVQKDRQRLQKVTIEVPLDHLKLAPGLHQVAYQVRVRQDGQPIELVCAPATMVRVGKAARVTGRRMVTETVKEVQRQRQTVEVPRDVNGQRVMAREEMTVRVPVSKQVRREVPELEKGEYAQVFAFAQPGAGAPQVDDPNIADQIEEVQSVPWTPPRAIRINFATNRNIIHPQAHDASRFGNELGQLTFGSALIEILVRKTHGERQPSQERPRPTPQDSFTVGQLNGMTADDFYQAISNTLWQTVGSGPTTKNDVVLFVHGFNNSFRFSSVRLAQLVYDTRFEGKPVLFSWPSNGGDNLLDEVAGVLSYKSDRDDAKASVDALAEVLRQLALDSHRPEDPSGTQRGDIHIVAHSMGCQLLVDALDKLHSTWPAGAKPFRSIVLAAPDVDSDDLARIVQSVRTPAERVTLYFCEADRALEISSSYFAEHVAGMIRPRAGQALCLLPDVEDVDANAANTTFIGHSYFVDGSLVLRDLEDIMLRNFQPEERALCPNNKLPEQYRYWKLIDDTSQCADPAAPAVPPSP